MNSGLWLHLQVNISMLTRYLLQIIGSLVFMFILNASLTGILMGVVPIVSLSAVRYGKGDRETFLVCFHLQQYPVLMRDQHSFENIFVETSTFLFPHQWSLTKGKDRFHLNDSHQGSLLFSHHCISLSVSTSLTLTKDHPS